MGLAKRSLDLVSLFAFLLSLPSQAQAHATASPQPPPPGLPFVINTWSGPFTAATDAAYAELQQPNGTAVAAVAAGCGACEAARCDGSVGFGGSPDEACETTLDALLMDGTSLDVGAVAGLRRVKNAIGVARAVLEHTAHSLLVGDAATRFAVENGFAEEDLGTDASRAACARWREEASCQPNFRRRVVPDPRSECGPYKPLRPGDDLGFYPAAAAAVDDGPLDQTILLAESSSRDQHQHQQQQHQQHQQQDPNLISHDTISLIAISATGALAAGTTTNGLAHRIPGRAGDAPIPGSGSYADGSVGGCGATGDGDVMMRFLPCYQAVESLRRGLPPHAAAADAVARMLRRYPRVRAGLVVVDRAGRHAGAAANWAFSYSYRGGGMGAAEVVHVEPLEPLEPLEPDYVV